MTQEQQYLGREYEPPKNADVERAIDEWLEAKDEQRRAGDKAKIKHASLLERLSGAGIERYPFTHPRTGKKSVVACVREPKAKVMRGSRGKDTAKAERAEEKRKAKKEADEANAVESRIVSRTAEHDAAADPFAATRAKMASGTPTIAAVANKTARKRSPKKSAKGRKR